MPNYVNPYERVLTNRPLRANFHCHADQKDGCAKYPIDMVLDEYVEMGYQLIMISNHDRMTDTTEIAQRREDIALINGFEYSPKKHMLCIGVDEAFGGELQPAIDRVNALGGAGILCHPNWIDLEFYTREELSALTGYVGMEIMNGVIERLGGTGLATDKWDYLLSQGKLVWGLGTDDFHRMRDFGRAWTVLYADSTSRADILSALRAGALYASTGLALAEFGFDGGCVRVRAEAVKKPFVERLLYRFIGEGGQVLFSAEAREASYQLRGDERYVRVEVMAQHGAMLFTQPIYDAGQFARP